MQPFHQRLAQLWDTYLVHGFWNQDEFRDFMNSLTAHRNWVSKLNRLENLADAAALIGDHEWENEIGQQMDALIIFTPLESRKSREE